MVFNAWQRIKIIVLYAVGSARSTFEAKLLHSRNSILIHGRPKLDLSDLIDSNVDRFMYLIERVRLGT